MPSSAFSSQSAPEIQLSEISVAFGPVQALSKVDLILRPGERHAVVGENGAGKSTLMRVLFGLQTPTEGKLLVDGTPVRLNSPADAMSRRIGMVQQHFELIESFTVAENILLGAEEAAVQQGRFQRQRAEEIVDSLATKTGLLVPPRARVSELSVATRQRVEILKALYRDVRVLILDEPTAVLSPDEATELWNAVHRLSAAGTTVVFVTHTLNDVVANAETVTVLRQGKRVFHSPVAKTSASELAQQMVGANAAALLEKETGSRSTAGEPVLASPLLAVHGLTLLTNKGGRSLRDIRFDLRRGEILGIAGVDGSGQAELLDALLGLHPISSGEILFEGQSIAQQTIAQRRERGIGYIPADRHRQAVVASQSCEENAVLGQQREERFRAGRFFRRSGAWEAFLAERAKAFDVRGAEAGLPLRALSGGNQQKLVLARELARTPSLLIAAQPTRGLDFAATRFVHKTLLQERDRGCAILLQSLDLAEVLSLSDRVAIMHEGRMVAILSRDEATIERIGPLMAGMTGVSSP